MTCNTSEPFGRPREYDRMQIGKDFVKWATNNPEALTVPMFAVSIGLNSGILRNWSAEDPDFRALYMLGKEIVGINRLKAAQQDLLDNSIYRAHVGNYDIDINEYMRDEKRFDAALSKEVNQVVSTDIVDRLDKTLNQISSLQDSVRKSAASNIKSDEKS